MKQLSLLVLSALLVSCVTTTSGERKFALCNCNKEEAKKTTANASSVIPTTVVADTDKDGVADASDKCPTTPSNTKVNEVGCGDTDKDGIADNSDMCEGTPTGTTVDETGCPPQVAKARGALKGVNFLTGSATLTPEAKKALDEVASTLTEFTDFNIEVQGHTDSLGNPNNNLSLSEARAKSVASYLEAKGVSGSRLTAKGYGPNAPVADNKTKEGRSTNRRVELKWSEK